MVVSQCLLMSSEGQLAESQVVLDSCRARFQFQGLAKGYGRLLVVPTGGINIAQVVAELW
jgi:hypothetical protein